MTKKITQLTPEQEALIPIIRNEWFKVSLNTQATDKQQVETAINLSYECFGLKPPKQITWFDNPVKAVRSRLYSEDNVGRFLNHAILNAITKTINEAVDETVLNNVTFVVRNVISEAVWKPIWKPIRDNVYDAVADAVVADASDEFVDGMDDGGFYEYLKEVIWMPTPGWLAFCAYFDAIGLDCFELKGLLATARYCGWWWEYYEEVAFVTPKPSAIRLDETGRLHAEGEPAVVYEGFNFYFYHGVRLPEKYGQLPSKDWQVKWLVLESNEEVRQVLIQGMNLRQSEVPQITAELTQELIATVPDYREKWRGIALSTERIEPQKASEAIKAAYSIIKKNTPDIRFFDSPYATCQAIGSHQKNELGTPLIWELGKALKERPKIELESQVRSEFWRQLESQLHGEPEDELERPPEPWHQIEQHLRSQVDNSVLNNGYISPEPWAFYGGLFDFCITILNCSFSPESWSAFQSVINNCGWIFPYEKVCFVCDRPRQICFDNQNRLHALSSPAIEFTDGYKLYSYHGVTIPEKYGKLHPTQWHSEP